MYIDFILERFSEFKEKDAIAYKDKIYKYSDLLDIYNNIKTTFEDINQGEVVSLEADFSPISVISIMCLVEKEVILVPIAESSFEKTDEFREVAEVEKIVSIDAEGKIEITKTGIKAKNELYNPLKTDKKPGLVLFSSGSTGASKGTLHDFSKLIDRFEERKKPYRLISFLLFDHIGGINTIFNSLCNGGFFAVIADRQVNSVLKTIQDYKIEILPTSPTFLNMIFASQAYDKFDLSSLTLITYGTEMMNETVLKKMSELLPKVKFLQTYGLSEVGIMKTKSESSDSLWVKVGGLGFETRIVDNMLEIKSDSTMLGYLNAPSPFTEDGWFMTKDLVEVKGDYIKFLGRKSEIINVGGQKVYPAEVEAVLFEMPEIKDIIVKSEDNILTGKMVVAKVALNEDLTVSEIRKKIMQFAKGKLEGFKIPRKIEITKDEMHNSRFKKLRK